jgi:hypothetical protein
VARARLLLDAHVPKSVADGLRSRGAEAISVADWRGGDMRVADDAALLRAAAEDRLVLVTFDLRTIPPLLKEWAETGQHHAGVVLVDDRTLRPDDVGSLVRAMAELTADATSEWTDRVVFLRRAG